MKHRLKNKFPELDEPGRIGVPVYGWDGKRATMGQWVTMTETSTQALGQTYIRALGKTYRVSTVLLGLDYSFGRDGRPLIFETMVFGDGHAEILERYHTLRQARAGHRKVVRGMRKMLDEQRALHGGLLHNGRKP